MRILSVKVKGLLERVDGVGTVTTLASTPADEGLEADDTSRSMVMLKLTCHRG